ncbi:MAG: SMC-Scp complex subunit ScpB [Candidatus Methanogranum gryphiswaldense]|nr:MAG: SMC-Scp complex subunit ScpB [Candidatus Methanogranum sp. U3.2.1]
MNVKGAVEAALFSSADNITVQGIVERTGLPESDVRYAIMDLRKEYEERDSAIMIAKIGNDYRMMLRTEYSDYTGKFARAEMTGGMMRTLSTIAYNQPVLQSELFKTRGARTYDDVKALMDMDLISGKKAGQTIELTTTKKFSEYFGIGSTKLADIRIWIEAQAKNM